jgi:multidrug resistance protein MdtO
MMWLVFERFFPRSATDEMVRIFVRNVRSMSDLVSFTPSAEDSSAILKVRRLREDIYRRFGEVNAQADAVPFETGPLRSGDMAARDRIRRWQASLRSFYLLEAPLLQFRLFGTAASKSSSFTPFEDDFRYECSRIFLQIAESIEGQSTSRIHIGRLTTRFVDRVEASSLGTDAEFSVASERWHAWSGSSHSLSTTYRSMSLRKDSTMHCRHQSCDSQSTETLKDVEQPRDS